MSANSQIYDNQLNDLQEELKDLIGNAKTIAKQCKVAPQEQQLDFNTTQAGQLIFPQYKNSTNYSAQFWKTYVKNELSFAIIKQISEQTGKLQDLIKDIEGKQEDFFKMYKLKNRKKNRRLAVEIQKNFTCPYEKCYKIYGSDVSLNLHIKLKHNGGNKTDRQKLAECICLAEYLKKPMPKLTLQLPPGYLQQYRSNQFKKIIQNGTLEEKQNFDQQNQ